MKTLVSGGAGFVGSHLVDRLVAEGHEVTVVDDMSNGSIANIGDHWHESRIRYLKQDISKDKSTLWNNADTIYHLACWPRSRSFKDPRRDVEVNLIGTLNVLEYARRRDARVVFSSNSGIYDSTIQPIREGNPEKPTTPYDVDKLAAEHMIKAYAGAYGLRYTIYRFSTVYGPRQRVTPEWNPVIATFIEAAQRGCKPYVTGDGHQTRDFVYVGDIVDALMLGACGPSIGPILLGSGVETSILDALQVVNEVLGVDLGYTTRPAPLGEIRRMSYDCSYARSRLGWTPKTPLRRGVEAMVGGKLK